MTASKIAALTACAWPGCTSPIHRRDLCPKHGHRVSVLEAEGVSRSEPETWEPAWHAHTIALRARRAEHGRGVLAATRARSVEEPQPAVQSTPAVEQGSAVAIVPTETPEPDRSSWPVLVEKGGEYFRPNGPLNVWGSGDRWYAARVGGRFPTARAAAAAIRARLPDEVSEATRTVAPSFTVVTTPTGPSGIRCPMRSPGSGERCIKELTRMSDGDLIHGGGCLFFRGDTSEELGGHRGGSAAFVAPQPPPTNTEGDVWQELIDAEPPGRIRDLMIARREQGIAKYGRPLGRENGRDHTADAIQEALDGMVYAAAAGRVQSMYAFRNALSFLTGGVDESAWVWRASSDAEIADLRSQVEAFRRAACVATGWGEHTSPGDTTLIETLRSGQWERRSLEAENAALKERAEAAEAARAWLIEEVCAQTGATAEEVAECMSIGTVHKPVVNHRMGEELRKRLAAEAEVAQLREAVKGAKVLDILFGEPQLSEKSRRVVALNTDALRALVSAEEDAFGIAAELIADTIDAECGIVREVEGG